MWTVPGAYTGTIAIEIAKAKHYNMYYLLPVSYTHLTLPTIYSV